MFDFFFLLATLANVDIWIQICYIGGASLKYRRLIVFLRLLPTYPLFMNTGAPDVFFFFLVVLVNARGEGRSHWGTVKM